MNERQSRILTMLIEEYESCGHQTHEHQGHVFARIEVREGIAIDMTDVDLTRLAGQIDRRLPK